MAFRQDLKAVEEAHLKELERIDAETHDWSKTNAWTVTEINCRMKFASFLKKRVLEDRRLAIGLIESWHQLAVAELETA